MQTPAIIPAEHADLWRAARAWFAKVTQALFTTGFTAIRDGKRPEIVGWLGEIERVVRQLLFAAALALRPGDVRPETSAATADGDKRDPPLFGRAAPLPAFLTMPGLPPASKPCSARTCAPASNTIARTPAGRARAPLTTDLCGELIIRFFVLQSVMTNPDRLVRRLALRLAARATRGTRAVIGWVADRIPAQPSVLMQALADTTRDAVTDAAALFQLRNPGPG